MSLQDQRFAPDGDAYIYANRQMWEGAAATEHSHNRSPQSSDVVPERRIAADNTSTTHTRQPQIWETAAATEHSESLPIATHALPVNDVRDLKPAEHLENATMRDQRKDKRMRHVIMIKASAEYIACCSPPPLPDPLDLSISKRQWEAKMKEFRKQLASSRMSETVVLPIGTERTHR